MLQMFCPISFPSIAVFVPLRVSKQPLVNHLEVLIHFSNRVVFVKKHMHWCLALKKPFKNLKRKWNNEKWVSDQNESFKVCFLKHLFTTKYLHELINFLAIKRLKWSFFKEKTVHFYLNRKGQNLQNCYYVMSCIFA